MNVGSVRLLFGIAALYDFIIGLVFLLFGRQLFEATGVPQPNYWAYVLFGALMLMIFGLMFFAVMRDPVRNRNLIPYGMLLKASYVGLVAYYWIWVECPMLFKPFAVIDALMFMLFLIAYRKPLQMAGE